MTDFSLLIDLHRDQPRQGPGDDSQTKCAIELAGLPARNNLQIADIGCGTGASTLCLARDLNADITAVDLFPEFLEVLEHRARTLQLDSHITTCAASMESLPFAPASLDVIWAEGAIYNIGFANGLRAWRSFLKPDGIIAVSEITWLTANRPEELTRHWETAYPEIDVASSKFKVLEAEGFSPLGYFVLPKTSWLDHYYRPLQAASKDFLERHHHSRDATEIIAAEEAEIALYEKYCDYFSYGFYIAKRSETT
jgi:SAM-dependent methyltransferase